MYHNPSYQYMMRLHEEYIMELEQNEADYNEEKERFQRGEIYD